MTRGGPRPHAGRKPTGTTLRLVALRLEPELIAQAKAIGDGVLVEGIRRALRHYQQSPPTIHAQDHDLPWPTSSTSAKEKLT
jgi:hypothetical protein